MSSNLHVFLQTRSGFEEFEHVQVLGLEPLQCRFGDLAVCLGSLCCWKVNLRASPLQTGTGFLTGL